MRVLDCLAPIFSAWSPGPLTLVLVGSGHRREASYLRFPATNDRVPAYPRLFAELQATRLLLDLYRLLVASRHQGSGRGLRRAPTETTVAVCTPALAISL